MENVNHAYFGSFGLRSYLKDDIEIWAAYQGMLQLNNVLGDINAIQYHTPIEIVADELDVFRDLANYLCRSQIVFDQADIDRAYAMRHTFFRGEEEVICDPVQLMASWPGWKGDAFGKLVSRDAMSIYTSFGYHDCAPALSKRDGTSKSPSCLRSQRTLCASAALASAQLWPSCGRAVRFSGAQEARPQ